MLKPERFGLTMPRFIVDPPEPIDLAELLQAMGMRLAFDRAQADFSGISQPPSPADRLSIAHVFHKTFVAVDEKGTEAAAATAVVMPRGGGKPSEPRQLLVDRPFLFVIRDVTNDAILFVGRVFDPSQKS
jgi:serpin B